MICPKCGNRIGKEEIKTYKESETIAEVVSIVAMLNKHGRGELHFGIVDDGKVLGQTIERTMIKDVPQAVVDNTELKIYSKVEIQKIG